ncbi:cell division protein ZapA [Enterococcus silesiacus]|uniref:Cell division protein ZapA n=2 Tax=Enterococcus TaxID=1350 RepID=R2T4F7_9ENTE|nr:MULTISPECIES: cell division protein ZapA [Enterococcus]ALS00781.1 cell division protein ZapA [Enterococcus silesiacus]EOH99866.1 cell division protein ZapA [Enterococcus haemoperoxidus ATCC BAA-382]EOT62392.1 cell division protein ZapA [Enterococcus haemoperoxidus ATCC BAA-382]OJG54248.1 cell division protein ZapA [Enterococcus haemoperoxidus]OJG92282.1 cell division protein ZapA [Enterococcus silesiacus]
MVKEKTRYKAVIADHTYTIIGQESKQHMDLVTKLVNEQLAELKHISPQTNDEQASVLLAINAISDQLKKQEKVLNLEQEVAELKKRTIRLAELENRIKRIEAIEEEARGVLKKNGQEDVEIHNHMEAQQILNENRKQQIQSKSTQDQ